MALSQADQLLLRLMNGEWWTTRELLREVPCIVHSRISDLRGQGFTIQHRTTGVGAAGSEYRLLSEGEARTETGDPQRAGPLSIRARIPDSSPSENRLLTTGDPAVESPAVNSLSLSGRAEPRAGATPGRSPAVGLPSERHERGYTNARPLSDRPLSGSGETARPGAAADRSPGAFPPWETKQTTRSSPDPLSGHDSGGAGPLSHAAPPAAHSLPRRLESPAGQLSLGEEAA